MLFTLTQCGFDAESAIHRQWGEVKTCTYTTAAIEFLREKLDHQAVKTPGMGDAGCGSDEEDDNEKPAFEGGNMRCWSSLQDHDDPVPVETSCRSQWIKHQTQRPRLVSLAQTLGTAEFKSV